MILVEVVKLVVNIDRLLHTLCHLIMMAMEKRKKKSKNNNKNAITYERAKKKGTDC